MVKCCYENADEANARLAKTVVMYDGRPVYVQDAYRNLNNGINLRCLTLPRLRDPLDINMEDDKLDFRNLRLGYVQYGKDAIYVSRKPIRKYQQGLNAGNLDIPVIGVAGGRLSFTHLMASAGFVDCMSNNYPNLQEARQKLLDDPEMNSVTFHRYLAIQRDELGFYVLHYKGKRVAWGSVEQFTLPSEYMYLRELIQESGVIAQ